MSAHTKPRHSEIVTSDEGFTLIEIIVALTILGISLAVLLGIFSQSIARNAVSETTAAERALAASLLTATGDNPGLPAESHGTTSDGVHWQIRVAPFGSDDDRKNWPSKLALITVTVTSASGTDRYAIKTLRLLPRDTQP